MPCSWFASNANCTGLVFGLSQMLIAQDLILLCLSGLIVDCQFGWDLKFFENFDSSAFTFFLPEGLSEAFIKCETPLHSAFLFQIWKHISDAICHAIYACAWMKCLCIVSLLCFSFYQIATFSPMHTLQACWCSLFFLCLRRYSCFNTCLSHRISLFVLWNETFLFKPLSMKHKAFHLYALDFTALVLSINSAWIMKNY